MYNVHMKRITASEARRNWFRLLDEVVAGETVVIERRGVRVVLQRYAEPDRAPDYRGLLVGVGLDQADRWTWEWAADGQLTAVSRRRDAS